MIWYTLVDQGMTEVFNVRSVMIGASRFCPMVNGLNQVLGYRLGVQCFLIRGCH